jgi:hypothetical protein
LSSDQYNLTLIAYDAGVPPLTGTLYIRVTVTDVNDNRPHFDQPNGYEATLAAGAPVGTSVVKVTASDPDLGDSGIVRYSFAPRTQVISHMNNNSSNSISNNNNNNNNNKNLITREDLKN